MCVGDDDKGRFFVFSVLACFVFQCLRHRGGEEKNISGEKRQSRQGGKEVERERHWRV